ncbi:MAG: histidine phosphatase family protein [Myxococcales bacterium]|nr:histidine phosphatase family protein [Myxococcales bacterium]
MPIWTFVRHGQSLANLEGWLAGHLDAPLTERGRAEAEAAREHLAPPLPTRAFCSDLSRAHDTARLMLAGHDIPLTVTPELRERSCGALERRLVAEVAADPAYRDRLGSWSARPPRGESLLDVALRAVAWLASVDAPEDTLVVGHGALILAVLTSLDRRPRSDLGTWRPRNCEAIRREVEPGTWMQVLDELRREALTVTQGVDG